jgi:hypothetical protein
MTTETKEKAEIGTEGTVARTATSAAVAGGTTWLALKALKEKYVVENFHNVESEAKKLFQTANSGKSYDSALEDALEAAREEYENQGAVEPSFSRIVADVKDQYKQMKDKVFENAENLGTKEKIAIAAVTFAAAALTMFGISKYNEHQANQANAHETTGQANNNHINPNKDNIASNSQGVQSQKQMAKV